MDAKKQERAAENPAIVGNAKALSPNVGESIFKGKRALVVGGSGGIGRAVCGFLVDRGSSVIVHGRTAGKVERCVGELGSSARGLVCGIVSPGIFIRELSALGPVDVLVVAFGPFVRKALHTHSADDWERMALLNLALPGALVSHYFPNMIENGWGRILLFGGTRTDSIRAFKTNAAYAAAKTGLGVLVKSIAAEGASRNIAAIAVCPGFVETEYQSVDEKKEMAAMAPNGNLYSPDRIARIALDILDYNPCPASGSIVSLDGGFNP
jgi:NAD(P)-dependent dehydrogenase (short-subunit alcohol dehydrogenase family)